MFLDASLPMPALAVKQAEPICFGEIWWDFADLAWIMEILYTMYWSDGLFETFQSLLCKWMDIKLLIPWFW